LDNVVASMETLENIARADATQYEATLNFLDERCLDVGPYLVLGLMRRDMIPSLRGGSMYRGLKKAIEAVALRQFLQIAPFTELSDLADVWPFPLRQRDFGKRPEQTHLPLNPTTNVKAADALVKTIDDWLNKICQGEDFTLELSRSAKGRIAGVAGELLDNAERHSDLENPLAGGWWIAGFMARRQSTAEEHYYLCHVGFASLGATIGESLVDCRDKHSKAEIEAYVGKHSQISRHKHGQELLRSVCALQHGITRFSQEEGLSKGGVGLPRIMDFIMELGDTTDNALKPKIGIISGNAYILVGGEYKVTLPTGENGQKRQWFNRENSIDLPPDRGQVFSLKQRFPGTVISIRFALDKTALLSRAVEEAASDERND